MRRRILAYLAPLACSASLVGASGAVPALAQSPSKAAPRPAAKAAPKAAAKSAPKAGTKAGTKAPAKGGAKGKATARPSSRGRRPVPEVPVRAAADDSSAAREARAAFERYAQAFNAARDVDATAFYSDDSRFHWLEDGRVAYTSAAGIRESLTAVRRLYPVMTFEPGPVRTTVVGRDAVQLTVPFVTRLADGAGVESRFEGIMSMLLTKASGSWRALVGHTSLKRPGASR